MPDPLPLRDILIPANVGRRFRFDIPHRSDWECQIIHALGRFGFVEKDGSCWFGDEADWFLDHPVTLLDDAPAQVAVRVEAWGIMNSRGEYQVQGWTRGTRDSIQQVNNDVCSDELHDDQNRIEFHMVADIHPPRVETTPARVERVEVEG